MSRRKQKLDWLLPQNGTFALALMSHDSVLDSIRGRNFYRLQHNIDRKEWKRMEILQNVYY